MCEDNFSRARLESTIEKNYNLKVLKNTTKLNFLNSYINSSGEITDELREAAFRYMMAHKGVVSEFFPTANFSMMTDEKINDIIIQIKSSALNNFIYFYQSYIRKLNGFMEEFKINSYKDLKVAYSIYRKANNDKWDLDSDHITEGEMTNLYNILTNTKTNNANQIEKQISDN